MKRSPMPDFSEARGKHLLAAVSGGADSVALLYLLAQAREELDITLSAAHVDHCIRGRDSQRDAEFCEALCRRLDVPFTRETINVPALARICGEGLETAARRLRYEALERIRFQDGADWIALAHHRDDQAETVLMHLLRGCGPDGIGGMEVLSGRLYRPLLNVPKRDLEDLLREKGLSWCIDRTNLDACTPRNALRLHGLPALEESYPSATDAIARYAEAAQCENRFMRRLTREFLADHLEKGPWGLRLKTPEAADEAILRRALREICGPSLDHGHLMNLIELSRRSKGRTEISRHLKAERTRDALYFLPTAPILPEPVPLPASGIAELEGIGRLRIRPHPAFPIENDPFRQVVRQDALQGAVLRTRRNGDRIRPLGCGDKLLSDLLTDRKVDHPLRDFVPLIAVGGRILWAAGLCLSEDAKLLPDTSRAVLLEWLGGDTLSHGDRTPDK